MSLTPQQFTLLREIARREQPVAKSYAPAKALVRQGLAEWKDAMFCDVLSITEEGRRRLPPLTPAAIQSATGEG